MNKNEIYITDITDISDTGLGIGHIDGMAVFVKNAAVGDKLKVIITKPGKTFAYAAINEIITPSPDRTAVDCPSFPACGGCSLRHIDYKAELKIKQNGVYETMLRIGGIDKRPCDILYCAFNNYRNKAQFPVGENGAGFYAVHSHRIVKCEKCFALPEEFSAVAERFSKFLAENNISTYNEQTGKGLVRHLFLRKAVATGEVQAAIVINGDDFSQKQKAAYLFYSVFKDNLKSVVLNINKNRNNVILGDKNKTVFGSPYITDLLCGVKVRLSVNSFYQVNHAAAQVLYEKAAEYAKPDNKTVLDLYCGAGTIGLSMARRAKEIIGVEIVKAAVNDAIFNARENGINNARFICADATAAAKTLSKENIHPEVVILDPPRKGCERQLLEIAANGFSPERIVYVSCDKATLARDVKILSKLGYRLEEYTPVDMFPRTGHCEVVCKLLRDTK